jgi:hypothetical protein
MNICIRDPANGKWSSSVRDVTPDIREAFAEYKELLHLSVRERPYFTNSYVVYRPDNNPYLPTYIIQSVYLSIENFPSFDRQNISQEIHDSLENAGLSIPIIDLNDIYVFIIDPNPRVVGGSGIANWYPARSYQVWAYRDFMYDRHRSIRKSYITRDTLPYVYQYNENIISNQVVTIDVANVSPNIVFTMGRYDNSSVYYERNDSLRSRVRICDSESARIGYLGFYTRLTMDPGTIVIPFGSDNVDTKQLLLSVDHLPYPEETDNEEKQCILCVRYKVNARFSPCEHEVSCSACYSKMAKNECPVCRAEITRIMNV